MGRRIGFVLVVLAPLVFGQTTPVAKADVPAAAQSLAPAVPLTEAQILERNGDVQMARKSYRDAIDTYQKLIRLQPKNHVAWNKLGIAHHQIMELGAARRYYERATKLKKDYPEAINNQGTVYYAQKNYKKAIRMYQQALQFAPNSASIHSNLGTALFARKKYEEAIIAYQRALELDPEVFEHRSSFGILLQERSVADRAKFHFFLAKNYAMRNMQDKALEYLRKAMEEGFKDTKDLPNDPAFVELAKTQQFQELMANPPAVIAR
jgi:tetratricopeptide (TPR) repeat protein